jgi:hypothetical protein
MKKIEDIQVELRNIKYKIEETELNPAKEKRLRKRIPFLKHCIMYLESNPDTNFVKSEITKVEEMINRRMNLFVLDNYESAGVDKKTVNKLKKEHEKKYDVPKLREQVRTLRFILN